MGKIHFLLREIHQVGSRTRELLIHPEHSPALRHLHIHLAGISHATTGFRFTRLHPKQGQLLVCFRGEGRVWINNAWKACHAGTAYLTPPHQPHAYQSGPRWEVGWILYAPEATAGLPSAPTLIETDPRPLEYLLRGLHHEISTARDPAMLESWSRLLHRQAARMIVPDHSSRLWRVWQAVQADPAAGWSLARLARLAGLGPENLRRICRRETGRSPMQHLTHLRMSHALSLLTAGGKIEDVAHQSGYDNAFAFSTAFKRVMKRPPSHFRG